MSLRQGLSTFLGLLSCTYKRVITKEAYNSYSFNVQAIVALLIAL